MAAADEYSVPWQMIATVHYRETNFSTTGKTKYGPYGDGRGGYPLRDLTDAEFRDATRKGAQTLKKHLDASAGYSGDDLIKRAFFRYNGTSEQYVNQAMSIGFSYAQSLVGEGSPYVMNRADARRDPTVEPTRSNRTWGQIVDDGGTIQYPARDGYGAFVVYKALTV